MNLAMLNPSTWMEYKLMNSRSRGRNKSNKRQYRDYLAGSVGSYYQCDNIGNVKLLHDHSRIHVHSPFHISNLNRLIITLQFESPAIRESFQASFNSFQNTIKDESTNPPGIIPAFSRLYYGCGIVFQMVPVLELGHF